MQHDMPENWGSCGFRFLLCAAFAFLTLLKEKEEREKKESTLLVSLRATYYVC